MTVPGGMACEGAPRLMGKPTWALTPEPRHGLCGFGSHSHGPGGCEGSRSQGRDFTAAAVKCRYRVALPTPARLAIASSEIARPDAKTSAAVAISRSRLRCASARSVLRGGVMTFAIVSDG